MDKVLAAKWIEALRSGKYKQGANALQPSEDTYCCLGVLCDITPGNIIKTTDGRISGASLIGQNRKELINNFPLSEGLISCLNDGNFLDRDDTILTLNFDEIADVIQAIALEGALDEGPK